MSLKLKIKTCLNDDLRLLKSDFSDLNDCYSKLRAFVVKSYGIKDLNKFMMQYRDDEEDLVTIASKDDLDDAIQQAVKEGKSLKIFLKRKTKLPETPPAKAAPSVPVKEEKSEMNEEVSNENVENNNNELSGNICQDINNEEFKKEIISFLSTMILIYQQNKDVNESEKTDLMTCIVTSLSTHPKVANHPYIKDTLIPKLQPMIPQIEPFAGQFLYNVDATKIEEWVNNIINAKQNNNFNPCEMFKGFGPMSFILGNVLNGQGMGCNIPQMPPMGPHMGGFPHMHSSFHHHQQHHHQPPPEAIRNCPKNHGLTYFTVPNNSYSCDACDARISKGEFAYGCRTCNWDCCVACKRGRNQNTVPLRAPGPCGYGMGSGCGWRRRGFGGRRWGDHHYPHTWGHGTRLGSGRNKWNNENYTNNNSNNNNNNHKVHKKATEFRADIIENPLPIVANNVVDPDQGIIKSWKMKNSGSLPLPAGLLVKYCGRRNNPMVSTQQFMVGNTKEIQSNEEFVVRVSIKTPDAYGKFSSNWRLTTPNGKKFGQKLPFHLILSDQVQQEQEQEQESVREDVKVDNNSDNDSIQELAKQVVQQVENEQKQDNNDDSNGHVDMEMNDSDDDDNEDQNIMDEIYDNNEEVEQVSNKEEAEEKPYKYVEAFEKLQAMGFSDPQFLKELLSSHQGRLDEVLAILLQK